MTDWPSEFMVNEAAHNAAVAIDEFATLGLSHDEPFPSDWSQTMNEVMRHQAEWFCQIKPEKVNAIYQDVQKAAQMINVAKDGNDDPGDGNVEATLTRLEHQLFGSWRGSAAEAVQDQVSNIRVFFNEQLGHLVKLMKAMAALRRVVLRAREDFISLCEATVGAVNEAAAANAEAAHDFLIGLIEDGIDLAMGGKKVLLQKGIEEALHLVFGGDKEEVRGASASDILNDWARATKRVRAQLQTNIYEIQRAIEEAGDKIGSDKSSLLEPLPPSTDITSPDFSWTNFYTTDRGPDSDFSNDVDQERKRYKEKHRFLDTPITRRLAGER